MGSDHETAACERDPHFPGMCGKLIPKPCGSSDAAQPRSHQQEYMGTAVFAEARKKRYCSEACHQNGQAAVRALFRRKEVRRNRG